MHPGQVCLQFSSPPPFFRPHCLYRSAVRRALIPGSPLEPASRSFSFRPAPALPVLRPSPRYARSCTRGADESTDPEPPNNTSANGGCCQSWSYGGGDNLVIQYLGAMRHSLTIRNCASQSSQLYLSLLSSTPPPRGCPPF